MSDLTWQSVIVIAVIAVCVTIALCVLFWRVTNVRTQ